MPAFVRSSMERRDHPSRNIDLVHDTLELFGGALPELRALWQERIRPRLSKPIVEAIGPLTREQFGTVTDVIRNAARIPQDRRLEPDRLQATCEYGLHRSSARIMKNSNSGYNHDSREFELSHPID
jgi:hypothetical protein